jgi:hypothetical protein
MRYSRGHARRQLDEIIEDTRAASSRAGSKPKRRVHAETALAIVEARPSPVPHWNHVSE